MGIHAIGRLKAGLGSCLLLVVCEIWGGCASSRFSTKIPAVNRPSSISSAGSGASEDSTLTSPFPSTIEHISIRNTHLVAHKEGEVLRGMSPRDQIPELVAHGVTDIVIFKEDSKGEVAREISTLQQNGYTPDRIHEIPFRWKKMESDSKACTQIVDALQLLETAYRTPGRSVFFHCTVGEDRTGMLAALFKMVELPENHWTARKVFDEEMCPHGYEAGNPQKPLRIVQTIRKELTPIFLKLATLIENGSLSAEHLDRSVCNRAVSPRYSAKKFTCKPSPLFGK